MEDDGLKERSPAPVPGFDRDNPTRSFFSRKLESRLREDGVVMPPSLFELLDVPFDDFTPEERELYDNRFRPLINVFVEALRAVYVSMGSQPEGWSELYEKLRPTPMRMLAELVLLENSRLLALAKRALEELEGGTAGKDGP